MEKFYQDLFNIQGYQYFIGCSDICYQQLLFTHCGIPLKVYRMCTNSRKNHAMSDAAIQARAAQDQIGSNLKCARDQLTKMKEQCVVCKSSTCDGTVAACLKGDSKDYCYS